jgi:hypothetical protein
MSFVFQNIDPAPPSPPGECVPLAFVAGGGHTRWVERGVGGQYFGRRKTQLCTLPIANPLWVRTFYRLESMRAERKKTRTVHLDVGVLKVCQVAKGGEHADPAQDARETVSQGHDHHVAAHVTDALVFFAHSSK